MVAIGIWQLWQSYADTEETVRARAQSSVRVVSANVEWVVETARQVLSRVDDIVADTEDAPPADAAGKLRESVASIPGAPKVYVIDAAGQMVLTTDRDYETAEITDREYFVKAKEGEALWVSSLMISRQNGDQTFTISRRMERNGRFAGVIVLSFTWSLLEKVWSSLALDPASTVGLVREDGWLVSRFPKPDGPLDLSQHVLFTDYLSQAPEGTYHSTSSPADGVARMVAYQRVPGTNLIALASVAEAPVRDEFMRQIMVRLGIGLPVVAILFIIVAWIARLLRNDNRQRRALEAAIEHNRMLLREVHHRVKNHLTGVVGLVNASRLSHEEKTELADRVGAMASLYASTYEHGDRFDSLDAADYIPRIVEGIAKISGGVEVVYDLAPVELDGEKAMALALIVNEVVTNAFKYAFDGTKPGRLDITLTSAGDTATLTIADNGKGYDPAAVKAGTGTRLIRGFAAKLEGTHTISVNGGTRFALTFRPGPPELSEQAVQ